MTLYRGVGDILFSPEWTEGEKWIVKFQFRLLGGFGTALANAICAADENNLDRLALGFPEEVSGYRAWVYGDLRIRLNAAGLEI